MLGTGVPAPDMLEVLQDRSQHEPAPRTSPGDTRLTCPARPVRVGSRERKSRC
ncbi:hypothetical protein CSHISOI_03437 [Colletotrichum shisoi]|uniref:Uncharacterized protein n=1 Tax=Colletotrichum shisoi TaxID=2078593 RepID=A0A5Q4BY94_9PEZI|nr:hypothetical protein CSHISOI_03437 [Colletotrichum shisoi]